MGIPNSFDPLGTLGAASPPPQGYTRLLYIECTGTQYILTGVVPTAATGIGGRFQLVAMGNINYFMGRGPNSNLEPLDRFNFYTRATDNAYYSVVETHGTQTVIDSRAHDYEVTNDGRFLLDGALIASTTSRLTGGVNNLDIAVFCNQNIERGTSYRNTAIAKGARCYSAFVTEGGEKTHEYLPCLDADGRPCLYDVLGTGTAGQNTFYNKGYGEFLYAEL